MTPGPYSDTGDRLPPVTPTDPIPYGPPEPRLAPIEPLPYYPGGDPYHGGPASARSVEALTEKVRALEGEVLALRAELSESKSAWNAVLCVLEQQILGANSQDPLPPSTPSSLPQSGGEDDGGDKVPHGETPVADEGNERTSGEDPGDAPESGPSGPPEPHQATDPAPPSQNGEDGAAEREQSP